MPWAAGRVRAARVLLTPHLAGDSEAAERRVYRLVGEQVARYVRGEPLANVVTELSA